MNSDTMIAAKGKSWRNSLHVVSVSVAYGTSPGDRDTEVIEKDGGQGVNRTPDTRIFSSSERPDRRALAKDTEGPPASPTELPRPTERDPNRTASDKLRRAATIGMSRRSRYAPRLTEV